MSDPLLPTPVQPLLQWVAQALLWPRRFYLRKFRIGRRVTEYVAGLKLIILPDVFNPVAFRTGSYFAKQLHKIQLPIDATPDDNPRKALDLGTGSGILAITAAKLGFIVDAVDLNDEAVLCARDNAARNDVAERVWAHHGDLFAPVQGQVFDLITFSPPSFRGEPDSRSELCWRSNDVFERFAEALPSYLTHGGTALVLQTSHGDEAGLLRALRSSGLVLSLVARRHMGVEILSIYGLTHS